MLVAPCKCKSSTLDSNHIPGERESGGGGRKKREKQRERERERERERKRERELICVVAGGPGYSPRFICRLHG